MPTENIINWKIGFLFFVKFYWNFFGFEIVTQIWKIWNGVIVLTEERDDNNADSLVVQSAIIRSYIH